jgi:transketolase
MPCIEAFDRQDAAWREAVLPAAVTRRVAIEAGSTGLWWRFVGTGGRVLGLDQFGASGKAADLFRHFGLTTENLQRTIVELLSH